MTAPKTDFIKRAALDVISHTIYISDGKEKFIKEKITWADLTRNLERDCKMLYGKHDKYEEILKMCKERWPSYYLHLIESKNSYYMYGGIYD